MPSQNVWRGADELKNQLLRVTRTAVARFEQLMSQDSESLRNLQESESS